MVSSMPGIDTGAPERTESNKRVATGIAESLPVGALQLAHGRGDLVIEAAGSRPSLRMYSTQAVVVMVNPAGHPLVPPNTRVISARFCALVAE